MKKPLSWNSHYLITQAALGEQYPSRLIETREIEDLIGARSRELTGLAAEYSGREIQISTVADFITAFRLNPQIEFGHWTVLTTGAETLDSPHDFSRSGPPVGSSYRPVKPGVSTSALEILSTYSDEPDWGMDQNLYSKDYGYGECPFGDTQGPSSQAAFHMTFLHENRLLKSLFPQVKRSFLKDRIEMFAKSAKLAFEAGIDYWGLRMTAWAMHYAQDATQPYHAKAFPPSLIRAVLSKLGDSEGKKLSEFLRAYLMDRHFEFEAVVHCILNAGFKVNVPDPFKDALADTKIRVSGELAEALVKLTEFPARIAGRIDSLLSDLMPYHAGAKGLTISDRFEPLLQEAVQSASYAEFIGLVSGCLGLAGAGTRYILEFCQNQ
jgi:hypothetical protein